MKAIVYVPNPVLVAPTKFVTKLDHKTLDLISEMAKTLIQADKPKGVGLAAPQVGVDLRIFVVHEDESNPVQVFINPKIIAQSRETSGIPGKEKRLEGCLSIPNVWGEVKRATWITLKYLDKKGKWREQKFTGFPAVIIQHELDHLDGILFTQRVLEQKGQLYKPGVDEDGKEILEPIDL